MSIYFSASTKGFYFEEIHGDNKPEDSKIISESTWKDMLEKQSQGYVISSDENGNPVALNPNDTITILDVKEARKKFINNERDKVLGEGFVFDGVLFDCDSQASLNLTATVSAVNAGIPLPGNFTWRSKENINVSMTAQKVVEFGALMLAHINSVYARSWALKDLIDTKNTKSAINKVDWNTNI